MGVFYVHSEGYHIVDAVGETIKTVVTDSAEVVCDWIDDILRIHWRRLHHLIVGLDIEWCPHGFHGTCGQNRVALLQLCVGRRCLIFQLIHCDYIPDELKDFLLDERFRFVGAGIKDDADKLYRQYDLQVSNVVDLRVLAATEMGRREIRQWGLKSLASEIMGVDIEKPTRVRLSDWGRYELFRDQIEYATVDAFVSFEVGRRLDVGDF